MYRIAGPVTAGGLATETETEGEGEGESGGGGRGGGGGGEGGGGGGGTVETDSDCCDHHSIRVVGWQAVRGFEQTRHPLFIKRVPAEEGWDDEGEREREREKCFPRRVCGQGTCGQVSRETLRQPQASRRLEQMGAVPL